MERSSSNAWIVALDRIALALLVVGLVLYVMPWWREGRLTAAFWVTFAATLLHVFTSHRRAGGAAA